MLPSVECLECFVAAARALHFRKAARAVALTPAAFGQRIKQLEDQIGERLFSRTTRSVVLTDAGLKLLPVAERALQTMAECAAVVKGTGLPAAEITIGTRQELGISWLVPQLGSLEKTFSSLQIHLYFGSGPDLLLRVRTLEIDCAIASTRFTDPKLDEVILHREDYLFVGAPSLLKRIPFRGATDVRKHTLLDASSELPLFRYFREAPGAREMVFRFSRLVRMGSIAAIRERCLEGAGVAVLPAYYVENDLNEKNLQRIMPEIELQHDHFRLVFRTDDPRRPIYEALASVLRESQLK